VKYQIAIPLQSAYFGWTSLTLLLESIMKHLDVNFNAWVIEEALVVNRRGLRLVAA
jgi:hypothetical protein